MSYKNFIIHINNETYNNLYLDNELFNIKSDIVIASTHLEDYLTINEEWSSDEIYVVISSSLNLPITMTVDGYVIDSSGEEDYSYTSTISALASDDEYYFYGAGGTDIASVELEFVFTCAGYDSYTYTISL